ncbi:MAG: nitrilase-related carbon-nitrogen hydrolase, partial [Cyclobacteriaceae bacterium]
WFASIINWLIENNWQWDVVRTGVITTVSIYLMVLSFGWLRIASSNVEAKETVKIAGVTMDNAKMMTTLYYDEFGKTIEIGPETAQTSALLQELNRAMPPFIGNPFAEKYENTRSKMEENLNTLFGRSEELADGGAKIVVWSEAIGLVFDQQEEDIIHRGQKLAGENNFYLIMGLGVIHPGPMDGKRLFMTNKTISITPEGKVANVYLKSNSVPFAEQDYGSDDIIPLIETPYGKLSPVICYDADFNPFMKQTGDLETDILLVPSGDWKAIAPYHSYMAAMRGIENGVSVVRPVSRGTSLATDAYGNVLASSDFFASEDKVITALVPTKGINTIYNRIGDLLAYACWGCCIFFIGDTVYQFIRRKYLGGILERWNIGLHRERQVMD